MVFPKLNSAREGLICKWRTKYCRRDFEQNWCDVYTDAIIWGRIYISHLTAPDVIVFISTTKFYLHNIRKISMWTKRSS